MCSTALYNSPCISCVSVAESSKGLRMNPWHKTLLLVTLTFIALFGVLYCVSRALVLRRFAALEQQDTSQNLERVISALENDMANLSHTTSDYSAWDQTVAFVQRARPIYVET